MNEVVDSNAVTWRLWTRVCYLAVLLAALSKIHHSNLNATLTGRQDLKPHFLYLKSDAFFHTSANGEDKYKTLYLHLQSEHNIKQVTT